MVENVVSTFGMPMGIALNMLINGKDYAVPMVVEEPSVVAAVSNVSRLARPEGFTAESDPPVMIGQIQIVDLPNTDAAAKSLTAAIPHLSKLADEMQPNLIRRGGGIRGMEVRKLTYDEPGEPREDFLVLNFFLDCRDAMGANMINTTAERLAPEVEKACGGRVALRILSNLADRRLVRARVSIPFASLDTPATTGAAAAAGIASASRFAYADPYRACTHNKGILNGVDPVVIATGNDWRAIEAGAHAFAARDGQYRPLATWKVRGQRLEGFIELPMQVGTVGGTIKSHPTARAALEMLGVSSAAELGQVIAAVGLAQNLGALRALATEGIQRGHMSMHARSMVARVLAADTEEVRAEVYRRLVATKDVREAKVLEIREALRAEKK